MGRIIIKLTDCKTSKDYYLEWSTIVDAPVTWGMSLPLFKRYYKEYNGINGLKRLEQEFLPDIEKNNHNSYGITVDSLISNNRAGDRGSSLTKEQIIEQFCTNSKYHGTAIY